jgi:hypothetical protein
MRVCWFIRGAIGTTLLLIVQFAGGVAHAMSAQLCLSPSSLRGRWGLQMVPAKSFSALAPGDPGGVAGAPRQDILRVGVINWFAAPVPAVTGRMIATTNDNTGSTIIITYGFTGSYTVSCDGTGTLTLNPSVTDASCNPAQPAGVCATFEGPETYAISITRKQGVAMVQTDNVGGGAKIFMKGKALLQKKNADFGAQDLKRTWSFEMGPAKSFAVLPPQICPLTDPGNVAAAPRQNLMRVGEMSFDGSSGVTGHAITTTDDNSGNTVIVDYNWSGTYTVFADGTGYLIMIPENPFPDTNCTPAQAPGVCATFEATEIYAMVIAQNRTKIFLNETDNFPNQAKIFLTGEAAIQ